MLSLCWNIYGSLLKKWLQAEYNLRLLLWTSGKRVSYESFVCTGVKRMLHIIEAPSGRELKIVKSKNCFFAKGSLVSCVGRFELCKEAVTQTLCAESLLWKLILMSRIAMYLIFRSGTLFLTSSALHICHTVCQRWGLKVSYFVTTGGHRERWLYFYVDVILWKPSWNTQMQYSQSVSWTSQVTTGYARYYTLTLSSCLSGNKPW